MTTWKALIEALIDLTCGHGELITHSEAPWASLSFSGTRHTVTLKFTGGEAIAYAEAFIAELPEHEFALAGQIVADAAIVWTERVAGPDLSTTVTVELLLLEEA
jgi:hypothetical protein